MSATGLRIRVTAYVPPDCPLVHPDGWIGAGEYDATMNQYGAVCALTPHGEIGVKPDEFVWVSEEPKPIERRECRRCAGTGFYPGDNDYDGSCDTCSGVGGFDVFTPVTNPARRVEASS